MNKITMVNMMSLVARNIDKRLYQLFKAEAVKKGLTVSKALEEAMRLWLLQGTGSVDLEAEENFDLYEKIEERLLSKYKGKYIVIASGEFKGAFDTLEEVSRLLRKLNVKHAVVTKLGEEREVKGEWWGGSISL